MYALQKIEPMESIELSSNGEKLSNFLDSKMYNGEFTNNDLVHFIEQYGRYLNLQTIPDYYKAYNMSYNGVKKGRQIRQIRKIFNVKFVIDND